MLIAGSILFVLAGGLVLLLAFSRQTWGPEGPVGAHLLTLPIALGLAAGTALLTAAGLWDGTGIPRAAMFASLPGQLLAMTIVPILPRNARRRAACRAVVLLAAGGGAAALAGAAATIAPLRLAGGIALLGVGAGGTVALAAMLLAFVRHRAAAAAAGARRDAEIEDAQRKWQREQWNALPAEPALARLVQFAHALDDDLRRDCRARIAAMPDLERAMQELLGTGWAEHALDTLRDAYPHSTAALAPALSKFLFAAAERWQTTLSNGSDPGSWYHNLVGHIDVAERAARDGGDVADCMAQWAELLAGKRGLEPLAARARALARSGA